MLPALKPIVSMSLVAKILEIIGKTNSFHSFHGSGTVASEGFEASNHQKSWKLLDLLIVSMNLVEKIETIGNTNSFHNFHGSGTVASEGLEAEEVFGIIKKLSWPTFSTTQAISEAQIVEKVGFDNFFHFFHEFLRKSLKS